MRELQKALRQMEKHMKKGINHFFDHYVKEDMYGFLSHLGPRVQVEETGDMVLVHVEVPGFKKLDEVKAWAYRDQLFLSGEIKEESTLHDEGKEVFYSEKFFGSFSRIIPLPCEVEEQGTTGTYSNGILEIRLKKK